MTSYHIPKMEDDAAFTTWVYAKSGSLHAAMRRVTEIENVLTVLNEGDLEDPMVLAEVSAMETALARARAELHKPIQEG